MKNSVKIILFAVVFVAIIAAAIPLYSYLTSNYKQYGSDNLIPGQSIATLQKPTSTAESQAPEGTATTPEATTAKPAETTEFVSFAADFTVTDMNGQAVRLSDYFGKPIVINFWATWCGPCRSELPAFNKLYSQYQDEVVFLMVNLTDGQRDTISGVKSFVASSGYDFPVFFDTSFSAAEAYRVSNIPTTVFIHARGDYANTHIGSMSESTLSNYIAQLLNR